MSAVSTRMPTSEPPPAGPSRASMPLLLGAAILVTVVVVLVLALGLQRPPALTTLRGVPDAGLSQEIAWMQWDRGESCLYVGRTDGGVDEVWCDPQGGELVGWNSDGNLVVSRWDGGRDLTIDRSSGEVVTTPAGVGHRPPTSEGHGGSSEVTSYRDGDALVVEVEGTEIWRVQAPDSYRIHASALTVDGRWAAFVDSAERLLVAPADGDAEPRVWATDVGGWDTLVWQDNVVAE